MSTQRHIELTCRVESTQFSSQAVSWTNSLGVGQSGYARSERDVGQGAAAADRANVERYVEREVPLRAPDSRSWKLGDPLTPDMIRVRPEPTRRRAPHAELRDEAVE